MSSMLLVKLRRDLRTTWSRFALMVTAIAVSLMVFGAVLLAYVASTREIPNAYMGTQPASATILLEQPLNAQEMSQLVDDVQSRPGVIAAAGRTQFTSDIQVNGQPRDTPLQVFVAPPDDPMQMAKFQVQQGSWPPPPGEIFVGRDSFNLIDVAVGDTLTLTTPAGAPAQLKVTGSVYDPSLAPAPQEQTGHAYLSTASLTSAGLDQLKIQVSDTANPSVPSPDRSRIVAVAGGVAQWLQEGNGPAAREIQVPDPYAHPHQWQVNSLLLALLTGGIIALVLSVLLVANMLNGLFTQQIPQIGIMKAIGARSSDIMRLYLSMTLLVALAATLLALAPAVVIGRALLNQMFGFLGILPSSFEAPAWTYALIVAVGVGLPPMMALIPLVTTSRTTVRAAIDHHGAAPTPSGLSGFLAWLTRLRRVDRGLLLALRNTTRRPGRFFSFGRTTGECRQRVRRGDVTERGSAGNC